MEKQNILFLYLKTGNGHIAPARYLKAALEKRFGAENADIKICHGFGKNQHFARFFFEDGYHISSAVIPGSYSLFYDINVLPPILQITRQLVAWHTTSHIQKLIEENNITKVVCFHFAIAGAVNRAIRCVQNKTGKKIPFIIVITDPFSAHPSWVLERNAQFVVFSDELNKQLTQKYCISAKTFPFILNPVFSRNNSETSTNISTPENSATKDKFRVLIAGGGEGLPDIFQLVTHFAHNAEKTKGMAFVVVCGRNKADYRKLKHVKSQYPELNLNLYGYVDCMPQLIKTSDCVITKAGASMIMEILSCRKPIIISTYIHGQELGNVRFVVRNNCGFFIQKPITILEKLCRLRDDKPYYQKVCQNLEKLDVKPDTELLTEYIYSL